MSNSLLLRINVADTSQSGGDCTVHCLLTPRRDPLRFVSSPELCALSTAIFPRSENFRSPTTPFIKRHQQSRTIHHSDLLLSPVSSFNLSMPPEKPKKR